jgi:hypothetical protein
VKEKQNDECNYAEAESETEEGQNIDEREVAHIIAPVFQT